MATRKVLQEIPILAPQDESQSFQILTEEETPVPYNKQISSPGKLHNKYISNDESKENISPAEFENITKEKKSEVTLPEKSNTSYVCDPLADTTDPYSSDDREIHSGSCANIAFLQQEKNSPTAIAAEAGSFLTPRRDIERSDQLEACTTPMDFSKVTVDDLGISSESLLKYAGKSPSSLRKYRRRSTIGVRGSPEMNFLIRQIALQKSSRKSEPEPLTNPFTSPRNSLLRDKISAFRNAFQAVEESEEKLPFPGFKKEEELQCGNGNGRRESAEPPEKRRRECDTTQSVPSIYCAPLMISQPLENTQNGRQISVPENVSETDCSLASGLSTDVSNVSEVQIDKVPTIQRSTRCRKRKVMFADLPSPLEPDQVLSQNRLQKSDSHPSDPVLRPVLKKTPRREFVHFRIGVVEENRVLFSVQESPPDNEENVHFKSTGTDSVKEKKKVTFGRALSPEVFDKTLPANTPLRRGSTPYNRGTPGAQEAVCQSPYQPLLQPDFDDQDEEETLQPLSLCFEAENTSCDSPVSSSLPGHNDEIMPSEEVEDVTCESGLSVENELSSNKPAEEIPTTDIANETFISPVLDIVPAGSRMTRSFNKRKSCSSEETSSSTSTEMAGTSKTPVITKFRTISKRSRRLVISKKAQIKASGGKGKKGRGKSKKSVPKPFYGERETASKKPLLSPIPELPESFPTPLASTPGKSEALEKKFPKTSGARLNSRKVEVTDIHLVLENSCTDPVVRKIEDDGTETFTTCVAEANRAPDILQDSGQMDLKVIDIDSCSKCQSPTAVVDMVKTNFVSCDCPQSSADVELKDEACKLVPVTCGLDTMSEDKNTSKNMPVVKQGSKRHFTTRKRVSVTTSQEGHSEMLSGCGKLEDNSVQGSESPKKSINDPKQETNSHILSPSYHDLTTEDRTWSPKLPFTSIIVNEKKSRSSRNPRRSTIFCISTEPSTPDEDLSAVLPQLVEKSASTMNDPCLSIDEVLQSTHREKKVRRSMRLRRDSGVGLSWVQENINSKETGRRKSLNSMVKHAEGPKALLENTILSPNKENLSIQHVSSVARKTRRRTLCTTILQENAVICDAKRRRSNCNNPPAVDVTSRHARYMDSALCPME
ncbi:cell division cycle-associated protein 2 isoform X2 [Mixophyes fleayi]|uniref:cell division cycle-associated protein 2 isoform X2 n=1 Tax=Mixophyes fleayi TaxID=3061075 RepID=UPI003F4DCA93